MAKTKKEIVPKQEPLQGQIQEQEIKEITIHEKYSKQIAQAKDGYLTGLDYSQAIEILRYIERIRNINLGLNTGCATCMIDLLKMLDVTGR